MTETQSNKRRACELLTLLFSSDIPLAEKAARAPGYIDPGQYIQHSAGLADGLQTLLDLVAVFDRTYERYGIEIARAIAEDDLVFVHCRYWFGSADTRGKAIAELFRFEDGLMVEHWDVIQDVPAESANANGMF